MAEAVLWFAAGLIWGWIIGTSGKRGPNAPA